MRFLAGLGAIAILAAASLSGTVDAGPRTPPAAPGMPAPFLGTAVVGSGGLVAAVDAYGDIVDLRYPGPAGQAQIVNPSERQRVGSVDPGTGITTAAAVGGRPPRPPWSGTGYRQRYRRGTNVLVTSARVGGARISLIDAAAPGGTAFVRRISVRSPGGPVRLRLGLDLDVGGDRAGDSLAVTGSMPARGVDASIPAQTINQSDGARHVRCRVHPGPDAVRSAEGSDARADLVWRGGDAIRVGVSCGFGGPPPAVGRTLVAATASDRRWAGRARRLGADAPGWARDLYGRSLLVLRALTDRRSGAMAAGARDRWAYVWPRDAAAGALALDAAGYRAEALRVARFLLALPSGDGARFRGDASPVKDGRALAGDSAGWINAAAGATGLSESVGGQWRDRHDYGEDSGGDLLGNAIAAGAAGSDVIDLFGTRRGLVRRAGETGSGLDSAAAWAVAPFRRSSLWPAARRTLRALAGRAGRYGIRPGERFGGEDPWTAPTAWSGWALAELGEQRAADGLLAGLRRARTSAGVLPERVGRSSGIPRSTTPLAWSHAFAALALRSRWQRSGRDDLAVGPRRLVAH